MGGIHIAIWDGLSNLCTKRGGYVREIETCCLPASSFPIADDGYTVISFGDTNITVEGVELTHDQVAELAGFSVNQPSPPGR